MGRSPAAPRYDGDSFKKGPWTPEEDKLLIDYIGAHGSWRWNSIARLAGLNRTGKSCRLRWLNCLQPDIKRVHFTDDEEKLLINLHSSLGNKWSEIGTHMPGRTDNEIKNYWNTHLSKKLPAGIVKASCGAGSSSYIQAHPGPRQLFDFSTSFDVGHGSGSSIQAGPARFLDFSTSSDFGAGSSSFIQGFQADPDLSIFDFSSAGKHTDLLSDVNPHAILEDPPDLDKFYFSPFSGSSSLSIKADPAQPPSSSFSTASGIVLDESACVSSSDISALFDDSVSSSSGAMRPLVGKLSMLLEGSVSISKRVKDGMHLLKDDVEDITSYLDELSRLEDPPPMAKCWMNEVRDLSYDMEDYIDTLLFERLDHLNKNKMKNKKNKLTSHVKIPKRLKCCNCKQTKLKHGKTRWVCRNIHHIFINNRLSKRPRNIGAPEMISDFRKYLQDAIERHDRYKLHCCSTLRHRFLSSGRMLPTPYEEAAQIVMDDRTETFINSLVSNDAADQQQLKVVSVLGSGCLGKTTLANVLYNRIGMQFDCRAFIRVPKTPDMKRLFHDLFSQLHHKKQPLPANCNELGISDNINNYLQDKRVNSIFDT